MNAGRSTSTVRRDGFYAFDDDTTAKPRWRWSRKLAQYTAGIGQRGAILNATLIDPTADRWLVSVARWTP